MIKKGTAIWFFEDKKGLKTKWKSTFLGNEVHVNKYNPSSTAFFIFSKAVFDLTPM